MYRSGYHVVIYSRSVTLTANLCKNSFIIYSASSYQWSWAEIQTGLLGKETKLRKIIIFNPLTVCFMLLHFMNIKLTQWQWIFIKLWLFFIALDLGLFIMCLNYSLVAESASDLPPYHPEQCAIYLFFIISFTTLQHQDN